MIGDGDYGEIGGMNMAGETSEKTCRNATLSTTNPI
jgi:hypothetical protein